MLTFGARTDRRLPMHGRMWNCVRTAADAAGAAQYPYAEI